MEWIKCSEKLPEEEKNVLVFTNYGHMMEAYLADADHDIWSVENLDVDDGNMGLETAKFWMPLPEPPQKE